MTELVLTGGGATKTPQRAIQGSLWDTGELEQVRITDTPETLTLGFILCTECRKFDTCKIRKTGSPSMGCSIIR